MKKRLLSILLAMIMALSILPTTSMAADSVEEALGEIDIYNGGTELSYLMINGRVRTLIYPCMISIAIMCGRYFVGWTGS